MKTELLLYLGKWTLLLTLFTLSTQAQQPRKTGIQKKQPVSNTPAKKLDIYVGGATYNEKTRKHTALYWKNGVSVPLTDGQTDAEVRAMAVVGNNVYAAGTVHGQAVYWKNGQMISLTNTPGNYGRSSGMTVSGNDVYVAGYERDYRRQIYDIARYWKNGEPVELPTGNYHGGAIGVAVAHDDVYAVGAGDPMGTNNGPKAAYWKNGQRTEARNSAFYRILGISIIGPDIYIMGTSSKQQATYWKNGQHVELTNAKDPYTDYAAATAVAVEGNDIYIAGNEGGRAIYWKNGQPFILGEVRQDSPFCTVAVSDGDVYVAGGYDFWKNSEKVELAKGQDDWAIANCVVLVKQGMSSSKIQKTLKASTPAVEKIVYTPPSPPAPPTPQEQANKFLADNKKKPGVITTASGLQYEVQKVGTGQKPERADQIKFNFRRTTIIGNQIQDSSESTRTNTMFIKDALPGLAEGALLMNVGSKYNLTFPYNLGFGSFKTNAPAGSILIFEVELLEIIK